jgi:hypothetical protein
MRFSALYSNTKDKEQFIHNLELMQKRMENNLLLLKLLHPHEKNVKAAKDRLAITLTDFVTKFENIIRKFKGGK